MDIGLIKAFLEVNRTRHFGKAADNLFLTQSAVSARVRLLEEILHVKLFARERNNIHLTPAGTRFLKYADLLLNTWNRAKSETALEDGDAAMLSVAASGILWDIGLDRWLAQLADGLPQVSVHAEDIAADTLLRRIREGLIDIGFAFDVSEVTDCHIHNLGDIDFVLASTRDGLSAEKALDAPDYVFVTWGVGFETAHARAFPDVRPPKVRVGLGRLALSFLQGHGGSAYLPSKVIETLREPALFRVADAPVIKRQIVALYPLGHEKEDLIRRSLDQLKF